jgi:hypothetical protein
MRRPLLAVVLLLVASPLFSAPFVKRLIVTANNGNSWNGGCPHKFDFQADITSRRPGDLVVQWVRSDGATGGAETIHFNAPNDMRRVFDHWIVGKTYRGWEQLRITDSAGNVSLSRRVTFSNRCR